jgi:hypothetical protein
MGSDKNIFFFLILAGNPYIWWSKPMISRTFYLKPIDSEFETARALFSEKTQKAGGHRLADVSPWLCCRKHAPELLWSFSWCIINQQ